MTARRPELPPVDKEIANTWCDGNAVSTAQMEAISLVTPILEEFFMRTISEALPRPYQKDELSQRCLEFIREEANHSRVHRQFNRLLLKKLGDTPAGLGMIRNMLEMARKHLSLPSRLLLAAALEHLAAVMSAVYMEQQRRLNIDSDYARAMFAMHAEEELGHRSVVFDMWSSMGSTSRPRRILALIAILLAGGLFATISIPWILYRKCDRSCVSACKRLGRYMVSNWRDLYSYAPISSIFSFARKDFHPDHLLVS